MTRFLDIASYQTVTDADAVAAAGVDGVWVKLTGEQGYENPRRFQQIDSLRAAGVAVGGYHFGDPRVDATQQARHFGNDAAARGVLAAGSLFPMFDAEDSPSQGLVWSSAAQLNDYFGVWDSVLRSEFGVEDTMIYGSESWFTGRKIDPRVWGSDRIWHWIANYNGRPGALTLGWSHPQDALHQWRSDAVPFPGIVAGGLDDNVPLRGHTRESLTIGDDVPNVPQDVLDKLLNAAEKITHEYRVTDGDPARPLALDVPDDLPGQVMSGRARLEQFIVGWRGTNTGVANIETLINQVADGVVRIEQRLNVLEAGADGTVTPGAGGDISDASIVKVRNAVGDEIEGRQLTRLRANLQDLEAQQNGT